MNLNYREASLSEMPTALLLLKEAAIWLHEKGIDQWKDWLDPNPGNKEWIRSGFNNNEFYFVEWNKDIVGMFRLQYSDEMFWGKRDGQSGYIHSLTTKRENKGKGIGRKILDYIESRLIKEDIDFLRLDCSSKARDLCIYYEDRGFELVGTTLFNNHALNLYEKNLWAGIRSSSEL